MTPALKLTKTFQNLYDPDEDADIAAPVPAKRMRFAAKGSLGHYMTGPSSSKLFVSKALPLTEVAQKQTYTAPALFEPKP